MFFTRLSKLWYSKKATINPQEWLDTLSTHSVPQKLFAVHYDRSSGPGGQHVNKVNSKCTLTLHSFSECSWVPQEIRNQLIQKRFRYYAPARDCVVIQSDQSRSREANRQVCLEKFTAEIRSTCWFPKPADAEDIHRWKKIREKTDGERLKKKRQKSDKKKSRGKIPYDF